jgi:hypothetical protein
MHPGGTRELAQWMHDTQIPWWGIDAGSGHHPMNTTIRYMRTDLIHRFEEKVEKDTDFHPHGSLGPVTTPSTCVSPTGSLPASRVSPHPRL